MTGKGTFVKRCYSLAPDLIAVLCAAILLFSCASRSLINDYFGIQMDPAEADNFRIDSYSPEKGVRYANTLNMNPLVNAWAEVLVNVIKIKVSNNSDRPIGHDYRLDHFFITDAKGRELGLDKGRLEDYPSKKQIEPGESVEFLLGLPTDYWTLQGMREAPTGVNNYTNKFWKGENSLAIDQANIKSLKVQFSDSTTIILKQIPTAP